MVSGWERIASPLNCLGSVSCRIILLTSHIFRCLNIISLSAPKIIYGITTKQKIMHLQKQQSRVYKGKEYPKYLIVIPPKDVEKLGWTEKDELVSNIDDGKLVIEKR